MARDQLMADILGSQVLRTQQKVDTSAVLSGRQDEPEFSEEGSFNMTTYEIERSLRHGRLRPETTELG